MKPVPNASRSLRSFLHGVTPPYLRALARTAIRGRLGDITTAELMVRHVNLKMPRSHALRAYRRSWTAYDEPIAMVGDALRAIRPDFVALDVGANVGDTAAVLGRDRAGEPCGAVLCIEGDPLFLRHLRRNAKAIGPHVEVVECFVGSANGNLPLSSLHRHGGTTHADFSRADPKEIRRADNVRVRRLEGIVSERIGFESPHLIKIDTDGLDRSIILSHLTWLGEVLPVLFYENIVQTTQDMEESAAVLSDLVSIGYGEFFVFDNFGNPLLRTSDIGHVAQVDRYLRSHHAFGAAVHYVDVCAVAPPEYEVLDHVERTIIEHLSETSL